MTQCILRWEILKHKAYREMEQNETAGPFVIYSFVQL